MASKRLNDGTLFMALEDGAVWPERLNHLKNTAANFQAIVQGNGETADDFAGRTLERWHKLLNTTAPPHRFMLGTRVNPDDEVVAARRRIARGVFGEPIGSGVDEIVLWGGTATTVEAQAQLLELAGALAESHPGSRRSVRVLFGDSWMSPLGLVHPCPNRPRTGIDAGDGHKSVH